MNEKDEKRRCHWCNLKNPEYVRYHDSEWGVLHTEESQLYELFVLEMFQAGLSWECILNKREGFRKAFDHFDINRVVLFDEEKIQCLLQDKGLIRNQSKIRSAIENSKIFKDIQNEFGSFHQYLMTFIHHKIIYETGRTTSELSDRISKDLQRRKMKFVGSTMIYSYLQAIGWINSHEPDCFLYGKNIGSLNMRKGGEQ